MEQQGDEKKLNEGRKAKTKDSGKEQTFPSIPGQNANNFLKKERKKKKPFTF